MKEKPILFSTEMVKAILEGRKSQTRRVIKPQPPNGFPYPGISRNEQGSICYWSKDAPYDFPCWKHYIALPYQVGDRLWVRESACAVRYNAPGQLTDKGVTANNWDLVVYRASTKPDVPCFEQGGFRFRWRTGRFMFKWQARLWLEVTEVRVQRLQEISPEDAVAEGAEFMPAADVREERLTAAQIVFAGFWDKLNGKAHPWKSNPWCWCYTFRRLTL